MIYIYALVCPVTGRVRYIGKCKDPEQRVRAHISKAKSGQTAHHCARWINLLLKEDRKPTLRVLITLPDKADWQLAERLTIARYRHHGFDLTNLTSGGDGLHDLSSDAVIKKLEARRRWFAVPENRERIVSAMTAGRNTPEHRKILSRKITASWLNQETRARYLEGVRRPEALKRRSEISKRMHQDPEFRRGHSERLAAIWSTPERREHARQRAIKLHSNPEIVERRRASLKAAHQRPDLKEKFAAIRAEVAARPEVKQKKSDASRKSWADPQASAKRRQALSSEECRSKMSESAKSRWQDPVTGKRLREIWASPESRAKKSDAAKHRATPEYRAMMAAKTKAAWASGKRKGKLKNVIQDDR